MALQREWSDGKADTTHPRPVVSLQQAQWLSGGHFSWRKAVIQGIRDLGWE